MSAEEPRHVILHRHAHADSGRFSLAHLVSVSTGIGFLERLPTSASRRRLLQSPTGTPSWYISGEGHLPRLSTSMCPCRLVPADPDGDLRGSGPCHNSLHWQRPDRLYKCPPASPGWRIPDGRTYNTALCWHACASSHYLHIIALSWCISRKGPLRYLSTSERPHCLWQPPTGQSSWCIDRDGGPGKPTYISTPSPCPVIFYRRA